jgi:DNA-directed RNA polymerase subunit K/omega
MLPIYEIIDFDENRYLLARAVMKRAREINFIGDEGLEKESGKIASLAMRQILLHEIKYLLLKEDQPQNV